ncbi:YdaU family protein [Thioalkalivibrio sp. ARh3]|uniref:YdaU family protein n=1 Tax=Thioalkalivibrio sp. ARh3 TaxID=1158148 RepID=UPI0003A2C8BA|nr:YdaU family protein [Thioalkalivibrio sp. ARh3]
MNHYRHHIGDYRKDTSHLSLLEHGIYRQAIDLYYLSESPLPSDMSRLMRLLCVRTADEERALCAVLEDFFTLTDEGYEHARCKRELEAIYEKSEKARESAQKRWGKEKQEVKPRKSQKDTGAMRTHSESNANAMLPSNPVTQYPVPNKNHGANPSDRPGEKRRAKFTPPSVDQVAEYCRERGNHVDPQQFVDFYEAKGWMVGKNKMRDWKAAVRTWEKNRGNANESHQRSGQPSGRTKRVADALDDIIRNGLEPAAESVGGGTVPQVSGAVRPPLDVGYRGH